MAETLTDDAMRAAYEHYRSEDARAITELTALYPPGPCPVWCVVLSGHPYTMVDGRGSGHPVVMRMHRSADDRTSYVCQLERTCDGEVTFGPPQIDVEIDAECVDALGLPLFTADDARAAAQDLILAANLLDAIPASS